MAGSGVGRGRGWLNLNKNASSGVRPGSLPVSPVTNNITQEISPPCNLSNSCQPALIQNSRLISQIGTLNDNDDGIHFNHKLKAIVEVWKEECKSDADVKASVMYIYHSCLNSDEFASKVTNMITSNTFMTQKIVETKVRNIFIGMFQSYFEKREMVRAQNPVYFRRSAKMLGEFYHKARLSDGTPIDFLSTPLVQYLDMLLELAEPEDLELFAVQLYLNGSAIKHILPQKLNEMLVQVRQLLINNTNLTSPCKVWMMLVLDVSNHRFGLLSPDLQDFYQQKLGDKAMAHFQGSHSVLSVQTVHSSKALDSFQSNVNVLQVSTPEVSPINTEQPSPQHNNSIPQHYDPNPQYSKSQSFNSSDSGMAIGRWDSNSEDSSHKREKAGRPILGAGARLNKNKPDNSTDNSGSWDIKKNSGSWGTGRKPQNNQRSNKGWEHDDRFENDYN